MRNIAKRWVDDVNEIDAEAKKLYSKNYLSLRYEDLLTNPFDEMRKLWKFFKRKKIDKSLDNKIKAEMKSNPDEQWQAERNEGIASFLPKGQAGNWNRLFTDRDKSIFKEVAGDVLIKWGYEKDLNW
ncbi:MAG: Sulfotransferase domain protein [Chloroflexi bacterium OLB14]|nr:MAG: Sulfotransferase domain protein [Chloroflexi bacterium OLB14]